MKPFVLPLFVFGMLAGAMPKAQAQQTLLATTAMTSPKASVSQTIGITHVEVSYSRPAVRDRQIWGGVIPFTDKTAESPSLPWRAGANENTTLTLSTAATINGVLVEAGTYGIHIYVYPKGETEIMLSSNATSWGSFYFDQDDVVATIKARRVSNDHVEHLSFNFSDLKTESAVLSLHWEKERIPLKIEVDVIGTTLSHLRQEVQSRHMINAIGPLEAATWCLYNDTNLVEALQWVNYSISFNKMFANLKVKSQILDGLGKKEEAKTALEEAMPFGSSSDLYRYAVELIREDKPELAMTVARSNLKEHPKDWTANFGMARVYDDKGDAKKAMSYLKKAEQYCERERSKAYLKTQIEKLQRDGTLI